MDVKLRMLLEWGPGEEDEHGSGQALGPHLAKQMSDLHTLPAIPSLHPRLPHLISNIHSLPCCYTIIRVASFTAGRAMSSRGWRLWPGPDALVGDQKAIGGPSPWRRLQGGTLTLLLTRNSHFHKQLQREDSSIMLFTFSELQFLICKWG